MRRLLSKLNSFRFDRKGNFAVLFGLAVVPIIGAMGLAIDYSLANSGRSAVQAALDNTALSLSRQMPLSQADLNSKGWTIFNSNLGATPLTFTQANFAITMPTTTSLSLQLNSTYTLRVAGVLTKFGLAPTMAVGAHSEVSWGNSRLRVALVLDNTGSMSSAGKIDALKTATTGLLTTLKKAVVNAGDVYVSISTFSKDVNVGASNYNASWLDWTDWDSANGTCSKNGSSESVCEAAHCSKSQYSTQSNCQSNNGTWYTAGLWTSKNHNTWNGCVADRGVAAGPGVIADYDQNITAPATGVIASRFPTEQYSYCTQPILGLTYDWTALNNLVTAMTPNGSTNQPIGLVWGWQSLVGGGPLTAPALQANFVYNQVIILLSDGLNTEDRWYGDGSNVSTSVNNRMYYKNGSTISGTCKNIKDTGVKIYAVQVNTGGDPTSTLMQSCATDPSMFFELKTAGAIVTTFNQIGTALANLHLSK